MVDSLSKTQTCEITLKKERKYLKQNNKFLPNFALVTQTDVTLYM